MTHPERLEAFVTGAHPRVVAPASRHDADLLAAVAYGRDEAAFGELYERHAGAVYAAALRVCRDLPTAEDIAQKAFMALWERALRLAARTVHVRPWLLTVARNAAVDHLRARAIPTGADISPAETSEQCPQELAVINVLFAQLGPALAALSPDRRRVIDLHYFGGLSYAQIAEQTGAPLGTVKSRGRMALEELRRFAASNHRLG